MGNNNRAKKWEEGKADEPWKVVVCAQAAYKAEETLNSLASILVDEVGCSIDAKAAAIAEFSGAEIVDALLRYRDSAIGSVKSALRDKQR